MIERTCPGTKKKHSYTRKFLQQVFITTEIKVDKIIKTQKNRWCVYFCPFVYNNFLPFYFSKCLVRAVQIMFTVVSRKRNAKNFYCAFQKHATSVHFLAVVYHPIGPLRKQPSTRIQLQYEKAFFCFLLARLFFGRPKKVCQLHSNCNMCVPFDSKYFRLHQLGTFSLSL